MGQCSSGPEAAVAADQPNAVLKSNPHVVHPECSFKDSSVTVATALIEDVTSSVTQTAANKKDLQDIFLVVEEKPIEEETTEEEDDQEESSESEGGCLKILPQELQPKSTRSQSPNNKPTLKGDEADWYKKFASTYGGEESASSAQMSVWSSELDLSMSSLGDRSSSELGAESTHTHATQQSSILVLEKPEDRSLSSLLPPPPPDNYHQQCKHTAAAFERRCSKASDPMSSWSDLNTSLNPACHSIRRKDSDLSALSSDYEGMNSFSSDLSHSITPEATSRRGSVTSIGTMNSWAVLNTSNALNPYGFGGRRSSAASRDRLRDLSPPRTQSQHRPFGRRYSMTPSIDTVSEDEDWNDSLLSSLAPEDLQQERPAPLLDL